MNLPNKLSVIRILMVPVFIGFGLFSFPGEHGETISRLISALISFLRTLGFQVAAVLLLPLWLGLDGIWLSIVVAELMAALVSAILLLLFRKRYGY